MQMKSQCCSSELVGSVKYVKCFSDMNVEVGKRSGMSQGLRGWNNGFI